MAKKAELVQNRELNRWLSAGFFRALSDPNRLLILAHLAGSGRSHTVSELAVCCPVDISVVSRHLSTLKEAGILEARRSGKEVRYRIRAQRTADVLRAIADALVNCPHATCEWSDGKAVEPLSARVAR